MSAESSTQPRLITAFTRAAYARQRLVYAVISGPRMPRWLAAINACFNGIWLGLFDGASLSRLDEHYYDSAEERTEDGKRGYLGDEWNLSGLRDWEAEAVAKHFGGGKRLVVTAAGAGREVVALLDLGHDAVGYEPHPRLVAFGADLLERRGHPNRLRQAPRDVFPPDADFCDGVVVGWGSYSLIPGQRARVAFLRAARERLAEGSPLLVSFFVRQEERRYLQLLRGTANIVRRARRAEPVELGDALDAHYLHYFTRAELERELADGGFRLDEFNAAPYGHGVAFAA